MKFEVYFDGFDLNNPDTWEQRILVEAPYLNLVKETYPKHQKIEEVETEDVGVNLQKIAVIRHIFSTMQKEKNLYVLNYGDFELLNRILKYSQKFQLPVDITQFGFFNFDIKNPYDIKHYSTYRDCLNIKLLLNKENQLYADIMVYDGDILDGQMTNKRLNAKIVLYDDFFLRIQCQIHYLLNDYAKIKYSDKLAEEAKKWTNNLKEQFLSGFKLVHDDE